MVRYIKSHYARMQDRINGGFDRLAHNLTRLRAISKKLVCWPIDVCLVCSVSTRVPSCRSFRCRYAAAGAYLAVIDIVHLSDATESPSVPWQSQDLLRSAISGQRSRISMGKHGSIVT